MVFFHTTVLNNNIQYNRGTYIPTASTRMSSSTTRSKQPYTTVLRNHISIWGNCSHHTPQPWYSTTPIRVSVNYTAVLPLLAVPCILIRKAKLCGESHITFNSRTTRHPSTLRKYIKRLFASTLTIKKCPNYFY